MNPFETRTMASFPVSIASGLALESIFEPIIDRYDDKKEIHKIKLDKYKYHVINVYTIIRNILGAVDQVKKKDTLIYSSKLPETVINELEVIKNLYIGTKTEPIFIMPDYKIPLANLNFKKENHSWYPYLEIIDKLAKRTIVNNTLVKISTEYKLPRTNDNVLITSHIQLDYLNVKNIPNLDILQSHTGELVPTKDFNSKYHPIGAKTLEVFPFIEELYFYLGDNTLIKPVKVSLRYQLHELALVNKWNFRTTREKVINDLKKNSELNDILKNYKSVY